jgi:uncharacterized membrane protein YhhN
MKNVLLLKSYIGFSILYLLIILSAHEDIAWFMKPFLLPFLLLSVLLSENFPTKKIILAALTFSWVGDIILMFQDKGELFFIFGLVAFLLSHAIYIILFRKQQNTVDYKNKWFFPIGICTILAYFGLMLFTLFPKLGPLKIPVVVYAVVITTMLFYAFKGSLNWEHPAKNYILLGAIVFVSSDSILAFNKFYAPVPLSSFLIMGTYIVAQYLIVTGILKLNSKK